ncbi:tetratricopeptide repeat protein [Candidatus Aerophobetes bacterium]|nr:tetratricopeptide repeat protein [Candidatus Aerophobetes bacterium]
MKKAIKIALGMEALLALFMSHFVLAEVPAKKKFEDASFLASNAQYEIGWCYIGQKKYREAKEAFEKVIQNYPQSKWADDSLLQVGNCLFNLNDFSSAIKSYSKLETEYPKSELVPLAIYLKAFSYLELNEHDKAKREYQRYLKLAKLATIKIGDVSYTVREATEKCPTQINKLIKNKYFFLVLEIRNESRKPVQLVMLPKQIFIVLNTGEQINSVTHRINYQREELSIDENNFFGIHTNPTMKIMPDAYQWIFVPFLRDL